MLGADGEPGAQVFPELLSSGFIEEGRARATSAKSPRSFLSFSAQASLRKGAAPRHRR